MYEKENRAIGKRWKRVLMLLSKEILTDDRVYREAKALVEAGHEVTVIMWDRYGERTPKEVVDGIRIVRINNNKLMKIMPNDLFRNPLWWRNAYKKALKLYKDGYKFDVVHCHDLDTLMAGVWLKKKLGAKLIYDAHEIFGYMVEKKVPSALIKSIFYMEKKLLKFVDHIITVNEPIQNYFKSISNKPLTIVMNCKDLISKEYMHPESKVFTLTYIGNLHKNRFFPDIVDVIGKIKNVKLVMAAKDENKKLYEEVKKKSKKYENIEFLGTIPANQVIPITLKGNAIIALLNPDSKYAPIAVMNKQFEAMVCGRPIITTKGTYAGKMTEELNCGLTVEYNEEAVKKAIETLRDNPKLREELGKNALKAAIEKYNWENEKRKLLEVYGSNIN